MAGYNLGLMYDRGTGGPEADTEAVKWYREAAEQGHAMGQLNLGVMYLHGDGVPKDYLKAYECWGQGKLTGNLPQISQRTYSTLNG